MIYNLKAPYERSEHVRKAADSTHNLFVEWEKVCLAKEKKFLLKTNGFEAIYTFARHPF